MSKVDSLLADYAAHHRAGGNVVCHFVGIPLIVFGLVAMLRTVPIGAGVGLPDVTAAELLLAGALVYYLTLDLRLASGMALVSVAADLLARRAADGRLGLAAFAVGWVFQGIGHAVYEKRSPAFLRNFVHLLVGPLFLVNEVLHVRRVAPANVERTTIEP